MWMIITATKKALPNTADQSEPVTWETNIQQRQISYSAFRLKAHELSSLLPAKLGHREIIPIFPSIPCQCTTHSKDQVRNFIPGITGHAGDFSYERKKNLAYITSYQVGYTIYMYDDANAGTRNEWLNFFLIVNLFHIGHNTKVVNIYLYII